MNTGVRETACSGCLHCQVCTHKDDYLNMLQRLEELFYSVPEEERAAMAFRDPDCKFNQKKTVCTELCESEGCRNHEP